MTQTEREQSLEELLKERQEIWRELKAGRVPYENEEDELIIRFFESNLILDGLLISRAISNCEAVKWMKEEIGMLRAQVRDLQDGKAA